MRSVGSDSDAAAHQQVTYKKWSFKAEMFTSIKDETNHQQQRTFDQVTNNKAEVEVVYETAGSAKGRYNNSLSVRSVIYDSQEQRQLPIVVCLKAESDYPGQSKATNDALNIDAYDRPPTARGSVDLVMAQVNSTLQVLSNF